MYINICRFFQTLFETVETATRHFDLYMTENRVKRNVWPTRINNISETRMIKVLLSRMFERLEAFANKSWRDKKKIRGPEFSVRDSLAREAKCVQSEEQAEKGRYYKRGERELLAWQGSIEILRYQRHVHAHVRIIGRAKHRIRALLWRDPRERDTYSSPSNLSMIRRSTNYKRD